MRSVTSFFSVVFLLGAVCTGCSSKGSGPDGEDGSRFGDGNIPTGAYGVDGLATIHFDYDSAALSSTAQADLKNNYDWLAANEDQEVVIEGHCDERGTNEYNLALGERRAKSVESYLVTLGISSSRISTVSYGEELPLDASSNQEAWAKNRRAHFAAKK